MAAELIAPQDELTGIPLPILPQEMLSAADPEAANWHHAWHPYSAPELQGLGGKALRHSRIQLVRATDHNLGDKQQGKLTYHDYYSGPALPTDDTSRFRIVIASCAGYIPDLALDFRGDEPRVVPLNEEQTALLRAPADLHDITDKDIIRIKSRAGRAYDKKTDPEIGRQKYIRQFVDNYKQQQAIKAGFDFHHLTYRYEPIRDFLRDYVIGQDLSHVGETKIEEFLMTPSIETKVRLGTWLLSLAVGKAAHEAQPTYQQLRKARRLHPAMPADARDLLWFKIGNAKQHVLLMPDLESSIKRQRKIAS